MLRLKNQNVAIEKIVFLGIGTNKGNKEKNISCAIQLLSNHKQIKILSISNMLKNPPQEGIKSGYFLNGAIKLLTSLTPIQMFRLCKRIEKKLGRITKHEQVYSRKKTSRTIDLDILFYGNEILNTNKLTIPHPMLHKRYFVLIPLMELCKDFHHPLLKKTIGELYADYCKSIKKYA
ncbi:MAG: 2-amino-4-hydroxy-6-hydroxymethyldihydropteridine diphosphokinase [Candidatus Melainabacteria bacterium]|nr:2-amino-4-hydroxy-6-hydroxymethyldihydropteridine diphosphokinase [Candidatus Melainabacteria bacterium]